jgi:hypothetical protein
VIPTGSFVAFLAAPTAGCITGHTIRVYGGLTTN